MELSVFAELAKAGAIKQVILCNDPQNSKLIFVKVETVFGNTIPLTTASKRIRLFQDYVQALNTLSARTGELRNVKVKNMTAPQKTKAMCW